ncbi:short-chain dehydrogenase [Tenacibaculum sp. M341]|uniref:short-chain dehydrogenase n=1 Tax=Tenacibaculum sp. M341 TaxID=2530339 RepID=UPI0010467DDB|nr:short-chain dehydrogenase [Tenacibaculum sp. M341]TCI94802.1 short-chain dehydrogenase [Tenacibaculum sp. M341]
MKHFILLFFTISLLVNCSGEEKTDQELLKLDKKALKESLSSYKIFPYKFVKIAVRSTFTEDKHSEEFQSFKSTLNKLSGKLLSHDISEPKKLSILDYISVYRDYKKMENFIIKTDEDQFPTITDALNMMYGDSISRQRPYYSGEAKEFVQSLEHTVLSTIAIAGKSIGKEISLYECSKTNPDYLPDSEIKTLLHYFRGLLFFEKGLYYLSEDEISRNIKWLENNKGIDLPYSREIFEWGNLNNEETYKGVHGLNHLFRGFDRLMMDREIDEERALKDFEVFLKDANEIGLENEIIWSVETYLYLKNEQKEKAIASLTKLKTSSLLSSKEKSKIDESIAYLQDRDAESLLNGVYDKYFLAKIATKYMFSKLAEVEWKKVLKEQNVPHVDEMFVVINNVAYLMDNMNLYMTKEGIEEVGEDLKNKGKDLFDKAKGLMD